MISKNLPKIPAIEIKVRGIGELLLYLVFAAYLSGLCRPYIEERQASAVSILRNNRPFVAPLPPFC